MHSTTTHNLLALTALGAFPTQRETSLLDISPHKWRKLVMAAEKLGVLPFIQVGVNRLSEITNTGATPPDLLTQLLQEKQVVISQQQQTDYDYSNAKLFNFVTSRRWEGVINEETSSQQISESTLNLLDIIIAIMDDIITRDIDLRGVICLGQFIRSNAATIDYEKLLRWLTHIGLVQVAALEGSMLIECFGFSQEELPFVNKLHKKASKHITHCIDNVFTGHSFSYATRYNVAMLETVSNQFMRAITTVTDIEE